jgi:RimJ/RimL family protein N-acetyltransferase
MMTPRLLVRPMAVADADAYHRVRGMMPFDPQERSLDESRALVAGMVTRQEADAEGWQQFAILRREDGAYVGDIGVNFDTPRAQQAEMGFAVDEALRGQGLAAEAAGAVLAQLFASGRHRVTALTDIRNIPTQRLLERLGFRREAHFKSSWWHQGAWHDEVAYGLLASEFKAG